jgi:hypothetical protein
MYNKKITSMILSTTAFALLAITLTPNDAFANHTPWQGSTLPNGDADLYFHFTSLNTLSVDGDTTSNYSKVKTEVQQSMTRYNNLGNDIDLSTTSSFSSGDYTVYATNLGIFGDSAQATYPNQSGDYIRFNTSRDFGTSGSCTLWYAYNLEWLTNHEIGHTVGLAHASSSDNSVMVDSCSSKWSNVQSHDDAVLDALY